MNQRLTIAQNIWKYAIRHSSYLSWYGSALENFGFYEGTDFRQWTESDLQIVMSRGQLPLTVNIINSLVNALSGVEIQSKYRIGCRIDLQDTEEERYSELSKALTHFLLFFQENNQVPYKGSLKFQDAMICGMAWSAIFKENDVIQYKHVNPLEVIPDFDDTSPQFDQSKYVCKEWYLPRDKILSLYPKAKKEIDFDDPSLFEGYSPSAALEKYSPPSSYESHQQSMNPLVCEVQYRVAKKAFTGLTKQGRHFETFDEDKAEEMADNKSQIQEIDSDQIMRTLFIGDCLLESAPLEPSFPGQKDFSFVPLVWQKTKVSNVPYGFIEPLKSIQMDLNKRVTNSIYYMQSQQYLIEGGETLTGLTLAQMKKELGNRNAIIQVPVDAKITVNSSLPLGEEQMKIVQEHLTMIQRVSGIQDEMLGIQTNATSGLAQRIRQVNSVRTNVFAFDSLSYMKQREARVALTLFQNSFFDNYYITVLDNDELKTLYLNLIVEDMKGDRRIENDVSFLPLTLYLEEVPDFRSTLEEKRDNAIAIAQNPLLLQMPSLLEDMGYRHARKYIEEFKQNQAMGMMAQQGRDTQSTASEMTMNPDTPLRPL
jgi:hypothetical protein